jgi:hypothetical protein
MDEPLDELHSSIPHVRFVRRMSVPRWAVEEPEQSDGEDPDQPDCHENDVPRIIPVHELFTGGTVQRGDDEPAGEEDDGIGASSLSVVELTYNDRGYMTLKEQYESGTLTQRKRFAYDDEMRLVLRVTEDPINGNIEKEERFYGAGGKIERKVITYSDGSQVVTRHRWNGNEEEEVTRSDEGIEGHKRRRYDSDGRVIERVEIDPETHETTGEFFTYGTEGQLVESGVLEADGTRWVSKRMTYNEDGSEDTVLTLDAEGKEIERSVSTYEHGDRVRQVVTDADGETCTDQTFDDAHHVIRVRVTGPALEEDGICEGNDRGLISAWAVRYMQDRGLGRRSHEGRIEAHVRTTWWEYEFYE